MEIGESDGGVGRDDAEEKEVGALVSEEVL